MEDLRLRIEHVELKGKLARLVDFIHSDEYYALSENKRRMLRNRKICMEMYLNELSSEVFEDEEKAFVPDLGVMSVLGSILGGGVAANMPHT